MNIPSQTEKTLKTDLKITIIDSQELQIGQEYLINSSGLKDNRTKIKTGCVYGGCDPSVNDIILSDKEKGVGSKHFMLQYDPRYKNKYVLRDLGEGMGTFIRIDNQLKLITNYIVSFGDSHMIVVIESPEVLTLKFIDGQKTNQKL